MEMEMKMAADGKHIPVLLMATPQRLIAIDMAELKINHYESPDFRVLPLPVFNMLNLVEKLFPFGMGFFVRHSKLYMVGGEKIRAGAAPQLLPWREGPGHDNSFGDRGLSPYVYVLDLTGLDSTADLDLRKHHTSMLAAKPFPIVEEIEGKIYVLSGTPWQSDTLLLPNPTFEVYDPSIEQWKHLPEPPFHEARWRRSQIFSVIYHSVVRTTLYVLAASSLGNTDYYYSYNVNEGYWKVVEETDFPRLFMPSCTGKFVPAYDDIFIYIDFGRVYAALIPSNYSKDRSSRIRYQALDEVDGDFTGRGVLAIKGFVVELGEHEMCVMQPGVAGSEDERFGPCRSILYITTFKVKKLLLTSDDVQDIRAPFLSVTCLSKGFYDLDEWGPEAPHICSAFFHQLGFFVCRPRMLGQQIGLLGYLELCLGKASPQRAE